MPDAQPQPLESRPLENRPLANRVALVTGAGSGIGRATAVRLAAHGARVVCTDIDGEAGDETARLIAESGGSSLAVAADVREEPQIVHAVDTALTAFGAIDFLHNNAGGTDRRRMLGDRDLPSMELSFWRDVFAVNLDGAFLACKHVIPLMLAKGSGSIVNTASVSGLTGELTRPAYGAAKAGLIQLTRSIATRYGKDGIRANAIAPGAIVPEDAQASRGLLAMWEAHHLTPRLGVPDDIAALVAFLASDDSAFITGQVFNVDGGFLAHTPTYADERAHEAR